MPDIERVMTSISLDLIAEESCIGSYTARSYVSLLENARDSQWDRCQR